jgi:hypothetical protein
VFDERKCVNDTHKIFARDTQPIGRSKSRRQKNSGVPFPKRSNAHTIDVSKFLGFNRVFADDLRIQNELHTEPRDVIHF